MLDLVTAGGEPIPDSVPRQVTDEAVAVGRPTFTPFGDELVHERSVAVDSLQAEIAAVRVDASEPGPGWPIVRPGGDATMPVVGDTLCYIGAVYQGRDFAGRNAGLWAVTVGGGARTSCGARLGGCARSAGPR